MKGTIIVDGQAHFGGGDQYISAECKSLPQGKSARTLSFWAKSDDPKQLSGNMVGWGATKKLGASFGAYVGRGYFAFFGWGREYESVAADFNVSPSDDHLHHHCVFTMVRQFLTT